MERPSNRPTDDELIAPELEAWALEQTPSISDRAARIIASHFHDGQGSALYSFASSGAIKRDELTIELALTVLALEESGSEEEKNQLAALGEYLIYREDRPPVEGWHEAMKW